MRQKDTRRKILRDIRAFSKKTGLSVTVIGSRAINDVRLFDRLNRGGTMTVEKMDRLYDFFDNYNKDK